MEPFERLCLNAIQRTLYNIWASFWLSFDKGAVEPRLAGKQLLCITAVAEILTRNRICLNLIYQL